RTGQDGTHGHQRGATYRQAESERHQSGDRDEDRPEQVELPLDGQGPEVLYGTGRGVVGHVVDRTKGKVPVAVVQRGGLNLGDDVDPSRSWQEQVGANEDGAEDDGTRGKEPLDQFGEERSVGDASVTFHGTHQGTGDEEPGEQEEDVDAARDRAEPDMVH